MGSSRGLWVHSHPYSLQYVSLQFLVNRYNSLEFLRGFLTLQFEFLMFSSWSHGQSHGSCTPKQLISMASQASGFNRSPRSAAKIKATNSSHGAADLGASDIAKEWMDRYSSSSSNVPFISQPIISIQPLSFLRLADWLNQLKLIISIH